MNKRVLVTGGTGFIGQHTLKPLRKKNYEVHVATSKLPPISQENIIFHQINLLNCYEHSALIKKIRPTHLLHSAWYTNHGKFWEAAENVYWLQATISLAETFFAEGGYRFLGLGTCAEYEWEEDFFIEDHTKEIPISLYGKVKKSAYECLNSLAMVHDKSFAWARIFFPYGPYESENRLIPYVIRHLLRDTEAHCTHGNQIRDFLHVYDMADALVTILDSEINGSINVGSGIPIHIRDLVSHIALQLKKPHLIKLGSIQEPFFSPKRIVADISKLTSTGWNAKFSLENGLQQYIHWCKKTDTIHI